MSDWEYSDEYCASCGGQMRTASCYQCGGVGEFDEHDDDPINFAPGERMMKCGECNGKGRLLWCGNCGGEEPEEHFEEFDL